MEEQEYNNTMAQQQKNQAEKSKQSKNWSFFYENGTDKILPISLRLYTDPRQRNSKAIPQLKGLETCLSGGNKPRLHTSRRLCNRTPPVRAA
jgi:hypothetical protein